MSVQTMLRKEKGYIRVTGKNIFDEYFATFLSIEDAENLLEKLTADIAVAKGGDQE